MTIASRDAVEVVTELEESRRIFMETMTMSRRAVLRTGLGLGLGLLALPRSGRARQVPVSNGERRMPGAPIGDGERFVPRRGQLFTTPYDNNPFIIDVETKLKCTCGCLHNVYECRLTDFTCGFWPAHHATIVEQATAGLTAKEIINAYVNEHGAEYLMAPAAEGFNLIAYVMPGAFIATAGAFLALYLRRAHRVAVAVGVEVDASTGLSAEEQAILAEELKSLEE